MEYTYDGCISLPYWTVIILRIQGRLVWNRFLQRMAARVQVEDRGGIGVSWTVILSKCLFPFIINGRLLFLASVAVSAATDAFIIAVPLLLVIVPVFINARAPVVVCHIFNCHLYHGPLNSGWPNRLLHYWHPSPLLIVLFLRLFLSTNAVRLAPGTAPT